MAESGQEKRSPITLAERFDRYRAAVQQVVERGIEHPTYELKRASPKRISPTDWILLS